MNRKIKFRIWDKVKKIYLLNHNFNSIVKCHLVNEDDFERYIYQQFTGLKDKNGQEIYEGDILLSLIDNYSSLVKYGYYRQFEELNLPDGRIHTFNYSHVGFFVECKIDGEEFEGTLAITNSNSIVIGNIFQNPELCESKVDKLPPNH